MTDTSTSDEQETIALSKENMKKIINGAHLETLIEAVLTRHSSNRPLPPDIEHHVDEVLNFQPHHVRVVVFGGGTGLSTVVGGNPHHPDWYENPHVGLKAVFPDINVVVCTTDDGGSTGELLKYLPLIGIGDIRKLCLAMVQPEALMKRYSLQAATCKQLLHLIQKLFSYRFTGSSEDKDILQDPLCVASRKLQAVCPSELQDYFRMLWAFFTSKNGGHRIPLDHHCLGNLFLTAAIFMKSKLGMDRLPPVSALRSGIDWVAHMIGALPGRLHPVTTTPGQLIIHYTNGVAVCGQSKALSSRRGFPIDKVISRFDGSPAVMPGIVTLIKKADVIIIAPGSLYTSSIPVLQVPGVADAIRANRRALKILAANFWIEEGETDVTRVDRRRGFRVSELCDAFDRNVPGGMYGLFHFVLTANLDNMPASILRNYALEGKRPIYLDRDQVAAMNVWPVEATIFSRERARSLGVVQHDPEQFALAVKTLVYAWQHMKKQRYRMKQNAVISSGNVITTGLKGHRFWHDINSIMSTKECRPPLLREILLELLWKHKDIQKEHLRYFSSMHIVSAELWQRSVAWDTVLGYYDPRAQSIFIHHRLLEEPERLRGNILIALGESLLGNYIARRRWITPKPSRAWGIRRYEITLQSVARRRCFLAPRQLHEYLILARMVPHPTRKGTYGITINNDEGFLPPGLLFGLMYAWYLDNAASPIMENEMAILHLSEKDLIPHHAYEYRRKRALVDFFRNEVFGYTSIHH
ncbi:MAG: YvcK family protein [Desulfobacterota bacterium]|nr:YvcK family protein [Thermodesulfobacteriota bacterium]